jgi:hypothetical protein
MRSGAQARAELPPRPQASAVAAGLARLGVQPVEISAARRTELEAAPAPAHLEHVRADTLLQVRLRQEGARLFALECSANDELSLEAMTKLAEQIRSVCRVNNRYRWPLDVFANKVLKDPTKAGARDELVTGLSALHSHSNGWVSLVAPVQADAGPLVSVAKDVKFSAVLNALAAARPH